ncbi:MAG: adenylate kinase family protein [Candidatus Thorarchaeota archaeon]
MKILIISGTPGCGKTSVAHKISEQIDAKIISLNELAVLDEFSFEYDEKRKTFIVDFEIFLPYVLNQIKFIKRDAPNFLIIEGHFSDIIPKKYIDFVFILRCDPDELVKRLKNRDYDLKKITENVQSEILGNSVNYFIQKKLKNPIYEIDTSNLSVESVATIIFNIIYGRVNVEEYYLGKIDWLNKLYQEDRLVEYFD